MPSVSAAAEELRWSCSLFVWLYFFAEVDEMKFGIVRKNRSFSAAGEEGAGGWACWTKNKTRPDSSATEI